MKKLSSLLTATAATLIPTLALAQEPTGELASAVAAFDMKDFAMALVMGFGAFAPAIAIGIIGGMSSAAIGRNPEAAARIQTGMILTAAFAEAIAIYCLVVALIIKFV